MTAYAVRSDVYKYGLARGSLVNQGRTCQSALASTDTFELSEHGYENNDIVMFRAADGGSLPAPIAAGTPYYAIRTDESHFQVSTTLSGGAVNLTTDGVSTIVYQDLPFNDVLEFYSRFVDGFLPAHAVPLQAPYPITVVAIVAELAARKLQLIGGVISGSMAEQELAAKAQIERWATGVPLRDPTQKPTNLAVNQSLSTSGDPRGWTPNGSGMLP